MVTRNFDLRYVSGPASLVIGGLLLWLAWRLWRVHPINRVFRLAPFVTERGMRAVLNMRGVFLATGLWVASNGAAKSAYWFLHRDARHPLIQFLGTLETGLVIWVLVIGVRAAIRLARVR